MPMVTRLADAEGVADGEHDVADPIVHLAEGDGGQLVALDLQHCEVGFRVAADHPGFLGRAAVGEGDLMSSGGFDDVEIGQM